MRERGTVCVCAFVCLFVLCVHNASSEGSMEREGSIKEEVGFSGLCRKCSSVSACVDVCVCVRECMTSMFTCAYGCVLFDYVLGILKEVFECKCMCKCMCAYVNV